MIDMCKTLCSSLSAVTVELAYRRPFTQEIKMSSDPFVTGDFSETSALLAANKMCTNVSHDQFELDDKL